ncbi:MAG: pimeloyl-ACP methyl ester carboxylesterase [Arenicella sp.]|jgi:pimeloyl-ACP methyl ester carboxylesterase
MRITSLFKIVTALFLLFGLILLVFWTPDTNWQKMYAKYGHSDSQFVELSNGVKIHYRDYGNSQSQAIVLIHGTSDSLLTWDDLGSYLENDYRLISLDLPGHGFTSAHPQADYSRGAMVESVKLLMDYLNVDSASLIGNSLGGGIAWRAALSYPDRVNSLVLLDPSGAPVIARSKSNIGFRLMRSPTGRLIAKKITPRALVKKSLADTVQDDSIVSEKMVDRYWELLRLPGNRQALTELAMVPRDQLPWNNIADLNQATLIVWGATDQLIPVSSGTLFNDALPNSQLIVYPEIGHLPMIEAAQTTANDIHQFLKGLN